MTEIEKRGQKLEETIKEVQILLRKYDKADKKLQEEAKKLIKVISQDAECILQEIENPKTR